MVVLGCGRQVGVGTPQMRPHLGRRHSTCGNGIQRWRLVQTFEAVGYSLTWSSHSQRFALGHGYESLSFKFRAVSVFFFEEKTRGRERDSFRLMRDCVWSPLILSGKCFLVNCCAGSEAQPEPEFRFGGINTV